MVGDAAATDVACCCSTCLSVPEDGFGYLHPPWMASSVFRKQTAAASLHGHPNRKPRSYVVPAAHVDGAEDTWYAVSQPHDQPLSPDGGQLKAPNMSEKAKAELHAQQYLALTAAQLDRIRDKPDDTGSEECSPSQRCKVLLSWSLHTMLDARDHTVQNKTIAVQIMARRMDEFLILHSSA